MAKIGKKTFTGIVIGDKMNKTIKVQVERIKMHPKYKKYIKVRKVFYAHDENNEAHTGDKVLIIESRPLSKLKKFKLLKIIEKSKTEAKG